MTLRQAIAGQWQVPLFIVSVVGFACVLGFLRPKEAPPDFESEFAAVAQLARQNRYSQFYPAADLVRQLAENDDQRGRIHLLAGRTRADQLRKSHEFGFEATFSRSDAKNYESIIRDYSEALTRGRPSADGPDAVDVYRDMALAYWGLNDAAQAMAALKKAIEVAAPLDSGLWRSLIGVYLIARPEKYLEDAMAGLELILESPISSDNDRDWAFVRKVEVLIAQGKDPEALAMLNAAGSTLNESPYGNELAFLRGRALRRAGQVDEAELILRELAGRITDRGDVYAQTLLELAQINYQQFRDRDARYFYNLVARSQIGKDWYAGATLGLAECAAMQQRYDEAHQCYQEAVDLLKRVPLNRAVSIKRIQDSLVALQQKLNLLKQYELSMRFMSIEQQIASRDDRGSTSRFARMYSRRASELLAQIDEFDRAHASAEQSPDDKQWVIHQNKLISQYFAQAGHEFLLLTKLSDGDDELYGDSLINAANSFNRAGDPEMSVQTWLRFVKEREGDAKWPLALFNLAQGYQAIVAHDQAITYYEELRRKYPTSPAAFEAAVPLARCYLAQDPPQVEQAEQLLRDVLRHPAITPTASHFRDAMFELGKLYYNNDNYARAISILTEATEWYGDDPELGKYLFLVGSAYRRSGLALDEAITRLAVSDTAAREKTFEDRQRYLETAREYFERAIEALNKTPKQSRGELDKIYLRDSWLYWADCLFDLGRYREAAKRYELAALRYQLSPTALAAYVQIVNCQIKLGNFTEARSANERACLQLSQMSDDDIAASATRSTRQQWQEWFDWVANCELW